jgi:hypothetical protein
LRSILIRAAALAAASLSAASTSNAQQGQAPAPPPPAAPAPAAAPPSPAAARSTARADGCTIRDISRLGRNPTAAELRCRYGARGPGRFGLLSYLDVPVYQPRTPQPGTHVVGVPGMPRPLPGESHEQWEWRVLRTRFGPQVQATYRGMEMLDPVFASRLMRFERLLRERGVRASRRETYRSAERQAWVFQQGRSREGSIATSTLTSWHNRVDRLGRPAARAADYEVAGGQLGRFHAIADSLGLMTYGADSNDPGHVYLPDTDAATGMELAVLRLLPPVPYVTLETGRPVDEPPLPGMPDHWRQLTAEFITRPRPYPRLDPAAGRETPVRATLTSPPPPKPAPPPVEEPRRGRRRGRG